MSDEPFYSPTNPGVQPRAAMPGERLWTMTRNGHTCHAELRPLTGMPRVELQIFADGEFRYGHLHVDRDWALAEATVKQEVLRTKGWAPHSEAG